MFPFKDESPVACGRRAGVFPGLQMGWFFGRYFFHPGATWVTVFPQEPDLKVFTVQQMNVIAASSVAPV